MAPAHHRWERQQSNPYGSFRSYDRIACGIITRFKAFALAYYSPPFFVLKIIKKCEVNFLLRINSE